MKTKEERNALKEEIETESKERQKLTDEELEQVNGGLDFQSYSLTCTNPDCLLNFNTYFSGSISGEENGMPCPVCNNGTWVVTRKYN